MLNGFIKTYILTSSFEQTSTPQQNPASPPDFPEKDYMMADNRYSPKNEDSSGIYGRWLLSGFYLFASLHREKY